MRVFIAEGEEHAERCAKSVVGRAVGDILLATYSITTREAEEETA